jgi:glucose/arabinose dehydrogenase
VGRTARISLAVAVVACALVSLHAARAEASDLPSGFRDDVVFANLQEPTALRFSPDGRVFVAEKTGRILVYSSLEDETPELFEDLRTEVYDSGDRGLLGLALDPNFPTKPYVYALYTYDHLLGDSNPPPKWGKPNHSGDECEEKPDGTGVDACPVSGRLSRFEVIDNHTAGPEEVLVEGWCQQYSSHSIGDIQFDASGALIASGGDGSDANGFDYGQNGWPEKNQCGDPPGGHELAPPSAEGGALRAQDVRTPGDPTGLSGTLIRVDPDTGKALPDNPMFGSGPDENARRIVAYGFRNPYRFAIDPTSGEIYVGNVGWNTYEEIDRIPTISGPVFNSGWPCYEGPGPNNIYQGLGLSLCASLYKEPGATVSPFFYYNHNAGVAPSEGCLYENGSALSGLTFYEGGPFPDTYDGALFFADAVRGCIYVMEADGDGHLDPLTATTFMSHAGLYPGVDLEVGPEGDLYYLQLFGEGEEGSVHRISYRPNAPVARLSANPQAGAGAVEAHLDASGSSDPHGKPLTYEWDLDGNDSFETPGSALMTKTFTGEANVTVAVRVSNGTESSIARVTIYPGDTPPEPIIEKPLSTLTWRVGQQIAFEGLANDPEEENEKVAASGLYWKVRVAHCPSACHLHPLQQFPAVDSGSFSAPDHDYPSHLEIGLTAVDSRGLSVTKTVSINPRAVHLAIDSQPSGIELSAGVLAKLTPFTLTAIEGSSIALSAPVTSEIGGKTYAWTGWSDGGARVHTIEADTDADYTAIYAAPGDPGSGGSSPLAIPPLVSPNTRLAKHPPKRTRSAKARFVFSASTSEASFLCRLDGRASRGCRSPLVYKHLRMGGHILEVIAIDRAGNRDPTPQRFKWTILPPKPRSPH